MACPALAKLSIDARAQVNQAYLEGQTELALLRVKKHLGESCSQSLPAGGHQSKAVASSATERPEEPCNLCHKPGHRCGIHILKTFKLSMYSLGGSII